MNLRSQLESVEKKLAVLRVAWMTNRLRGVDVAIEKINRLLMPDAVWDYNERSSVELTGNALVVYKEPLYQESYRLPSLFPTKRQSQWQSIQIIDIFDGLGYRVDVVAHDEDVDINDPSGYDVIFGVNPNFYEYATAAGPETTKIEFATAMHWSQRNDAIRKDYRRFNEKHGTDFSPRRTVGEYPSRQVADGVLIIGDKGARQTYEAHLEETPVKNVEAATYDFLSCGVEEKEFHKARKNFLWVSGSGFIFKGLDMVLDVFAELDEYNLYVCAPLETDVEFVNLYREELFNTDNIHTEGFVDLQSDRFEVLTETCGYTIAPSMTEGSPGSVIHLARRGVVPILTPQVFDDVDGWGLRLTDRDVPTLRETIHDATNVNPEVLKSMAQTACQRTEKKNSRERFTSEIHTALVSLLDIEDQQQPIVPGRTS